MGPYPSTSVLPDRDTGGILELEPRTQLFGLVPAPQGASPSFREKAKQVRPIHDGVSRSPHSSDCGYQILGLLIASPSPSVVADSGHMSPGRCEAEGARPGLIPHLSSTWAMDGFQSLMSLNFYPNLGTLGTCSFSQVRCCLQVDYGLSPVLGSTAPIVVFGQPGELGLLSRKPEDSSPYVSDLSSLFSLSPRSR